MGQKVKGRSANSLRNIFTGLTSKIVLMLLAFATRTVFVRLLGAEYTGISSLYSNILSVLSLAELGLGNVMMFYLYKAIQQGDKGTIASIVLEFRSIYFKIILLIIGIGLSIIPFLKYIVNSSLDANELYGYYILYLVNSVLSYFVVYRTAVLAADQKYYIHNVVQTVSTVLMYIFQILFLLIYKSFWGYLIIQVLCTMFSNIVLNNIAIKQYPYLKHTDLINSTRPLLRKEDISSNIRAAFIYKISETIVDQTDNIIISAMLGTAIVGYYSNYYILISYVSAFAGIIANGLVASFGNLNAEGDMKRSYDMFRIALTAFSLFGTICCTCYACVIQDFIPLWVGNEYLMKYSLVFAILLVFYLRMATNTIWMYRSSMGLFKECKYIYLFTAVLNIVLSCALGKTYGVFGIIIATFISRVTTSFWFEGKVVFKRFNKPVKIYFALQLKFAICCICSVCIGLLICRSINIPGFYGFAVKFIVSILLSSIFEYFIYRTNPDFLAMKDKVLSAIKNYH